MLHIHRAERADGLVLALRAILADPPEDPFAPEVVAVPTRGMERWLTQRLSDGLGICANVGFPPPRVLIGDAIAAVSGVDPETDPWVPERLVWPLLEIVTGALEEPWAGDLATHLGGADDAVRRARRYATVRHLAGLFDRYGTYRPELIGAWAAGAGDDWQPQLWRRLRARVGVPSPAERLAVGCARLRADPGLVALPSRVGLFGLTRLPAAELDVLRALGAARDVHLFVLHPSPALWDAIAALPPGDPIVRRADDRTAGLPGNRMLASWGNDARELQLVLAGDGAADHHHPVAHAEGTLLARIQADVRANRAPAGDLVLDPGDRSVQVHACHGRARQVEALRDAILHRLDEDPTLEPRDVIVMCPDIETFAPLIHATFGAGEVSEEDDEALPEALRPPDLRVRLADRSLRQTNPVLGAVAGLLDLADARLTASQVLDLADREPVRRRFRLDDDDVGRLEDWIAESGIRWGLDAGHRAPFKLAEVPAGTWRRGLDRLLLGVTMTEDGERIVGGVLPLDDVDSGAIDLAGRFAELIDRLGAALAALQGPQPLATWAAALADAADALCASGPRDAWQRAQLQRLLDTAVAEADGVAAPLTLPEVRALLAERLQGRPTRANFRTGHLTICTLVPMRSVPHRVVCLLGLDDGVFPRRGPRDGDDLLLAHPHVGERDARSEDRQQLLDALMAAGDTLIVTYTGNDERTNLPQPPAVPVGELLDVVGRTVVTGDAHGVLVRHPLQPFDPRNFVAGELIGGRAWSFDRAGLDGARALKADRIEPGPFLPGPLPPPDARIVELEDLLAFVAHPVRAFLRHRLGVSVRGGEDEVADGLPVELDALERYQVGQRLLEARLEGTGRREAILAEIARGTLPPGGLGRPVVAALEPVADAIYAQAGAGAGESVDVRVALADGRLLSGTVPGVAGDTLRAVSYARVGPRHRLQAWVRLLALTAAHPERSFDALTVGRVRLGGDGEVTVARIPPLDAGEARAELAVLLDLYDRGMREPAPLACTTSAAYAGAGSNAARAAAGAWESAWNFDKEDRDREHLLVLGGERTFVQLCEEGPRPDESGPGWDGRDPTRFGRWARRLWDPLLRREELREA